MKYNGQAIQLLLSVFLSVSGLFVVSGARGIETPLGKTPASFTIKDSSGRKVADISLITGYPAGLMILAGITGVSGVPSTNISQEKLEELKELLDSLVLPAGLQIPDINAVLSFWPAFMGNAGNLGTISAATGSAGELHLTLTAIEVSGQITPSLQLTPQPASPGFPISVLVNSGNFSGTYQIVYDPGSSIDASASSPSFRDEEYDDPDCGSLWQLICNLCCFCCRSGGGSGGEGSSCSGRPAEDSPLLSSRQAALMFYPGIWLVPLSQHRKLR